MISFTVRTIAAIAALACETAGDRVNDLIPETFCAPFGSYPNPLNLTEDDRRRFAAVVKFPLKKLSNGSEVPNYRVMYLTKPLENPPVQLVSLEQFRQAQADQARGECSDGDPPFREWDWFGVGRYDENRLGMYESDLFQVEDPESKRTIHIGIDLDGPVGTPVHAFYEGTVQSVGYNPALGDYGHVIVIQHSLPENRTVFALYGHLGSGIGENFQVGSRIQTGQVIGHMGAFWENGGWTIPHVHFQLSLKPPIVQHDMPGAVAPKDRAWALFEYPDPRYVLGPLY